MWFVGMTATKRTPSRPETRSGQNSKKIRARSATTQHRAQNPTRQFQRRKRRREARIQHRVRPRLPRNFRLGARNRRRGGRQLQSRQPPSPSQLRRLRRSCPRPSRSPSQRLQCPLRWLPRRRLLEAHLSLKQKMNLRLQHYRQTSALQVSPKPPHRNHRELEEAREEAEVGAEASLSGG